MDGSSCWALDASVVINLLGTGRERDFLAVVPRACVTRAVRREVTRCRRPDRPPGDPVAPLVADGLLAVVDLGPEAEVLYFDLLTAPKPDGLDDGEASTIAYAMAHGAGCVIDERKGLRIARARFAAMPVRTTYDILRRGEPLVGPTGLAQAVKDARAYARMRVPPEEAGWVRGFTSE